MKLGNIALIIIQNRKRAEVAGKAGSRHCCFCVSGFSPFSPFPLFVPLFHTSYSGYDFFLKIDKLAKATNPGNNEKLKKRYPFETRLRKGLAKTNTYL